MKPLEHHTQNQTDADAERIGFLIELHCVLEPVLHRCSSYGTDPGNGQGRERTLLMMVTPLAATRAGARNCPGILPRDRGGPGRSGLLAPRVSSKGLSDGQRSIGVNAMFHIDCGEPELALQRLDVAEALVAEQRLAR